MRGRGRRGPRDVVRNKLNVQRGRQKLCQWIQSVRFRSDLFARAYTLRARTLYLHVYTRSFLCSMDQHRRSGKSAFFGAHYCRPFDGFCNRYVPFDVPPPPRPLYIIYSAVRARACVCILYAVWPTLNVFLFVSYPRNKNTFPPETSPSAFLPYILTTLHFSHSLPLRIIIYNNTACSAAASTMTRRARNFHHFFSHPVTLLQCPARRYYILYVYDCAYSIQTMSDTRPTAAAA